MSPACLQLEITESLAAQDEGVQARLHALRACGITLALDDFGTGYSSLSSLHLLPVDTVKIDRSFVSLVDTSAHHRVLIEATIRVARSLGMRTVAEGIETDEQAAVIRELGCDKGQGYLFSRPVTGDELVHLARLRRTARGIVRLRIAHTDHAARGHSTTFPPGTRMTLTILFLSRFRAGQRSRPGAPRSNGPRTAWI